MEPQKPSVIMELPVLGGVHQYNFTINIIYYLYNGYKKTQNAHIKTFEIDITKLKLEYPYIVRGIE